MEADWLEFDWLEADDGSDRDSEAMDDIEDRSVLGAEAIDPSRVEASDKVTILIPIPSLPVAGMNNVVLPSLNFICCLFGW